MIPENDQRPSPWTVAVATIAAIVVGLLAGAFAGGGLCESKPGGCELEGIAYVGFGALIAAFVAVPIAVIFTLRVERRGSQTSRVVLSAASGLVLVAALGAALGTWVHEAQQMVQPLPRTPYECTVEPRFRPDFCKRLDVVPVAERSDDGTIRVMGGAVLGGALGAAGFGMLKRRSLRSGTDRRGGSKWWRRPAVAVSGSVVLAVVVTAAVLFRPWDSGPEPAACTYDKDSRTVTVSLSGRMEIGIPQLSVESGAIVLRESDPPERGPTRACGSATTTNTDRVYAQGPNGGHIELYVDQSGGALAPGATPEATGLSEIEIEIAHGHVYLFGTDAPNLVRVGTLGANVNGDDDVDVASVNGPLIFDMDGGPEGDDMRATGGLGTGMPVQSWYARGRGGPDTIVGGFDGGYLEGDAGDDTLVGGAGDDILHGGDGVDRCVGGGGQDSLELCETKSGGADTGE